MKSKLFTILVLAAAAALLLSACSSGPAPLNITIKGEDIKFSPNQIDAKVNQTVNVTYTNTGALDHSFLIDELGVKYDKVTPGQTINFSFTPTAAGEYRIYCSQAGHVEGGMVGKLVVTP